MPDPKIRILQNLAAAIETFPSKEKLGRMSTYETNKLRRNFAPKVADYYANYMTNEMAISPSNLALTKTIIDLLDLSATARSLQLGNTIFTTRDFLLRGARVQEKIHRFWECVFLTIHTENEKDNVDWAVNTFLQAVGTDTLRVNKPFQEGIFSETQMTDLVEKLASKTIRARNLFPAQEIFYHAHSMDIRISPKIHEEMVELVGRGIRSGWPLPNSKSVAFLYNRVKEIRDKTQRTRLLKRLDAYSSMAPKRSLEPEKEYLTPTEVKARQTALDNTVLLLKTKNGPFIS